MRRPDGSERSVCPVVDIRLVPALCLEISEPLQEVAVHLSVMKWWKYAAAPYADLSDCS